MLLDRANKKVAPYAKWIGFAVLAAIVAGIGWLVYRYQQTGQRSDATLELIQASASQDPEVLRDVSVRYPGTAAAAWAKLYQGQLELSEGINTLYRDRIEATELLTRAKDALQAAIDDSSDPLLQSRAHMALGRAEESLGNLDEAIAAYQQVAAMGESDAVVEQAEDRIAALSEPATAAFIEWFQDQDFAPQDPSLPPALGGVETLPDDPDLPLLELEPTMPGAADGEDTEPSEPSESEGEPGESAAEGETDDGAAAEGADQQPAANGSDEAEPAPPAEENG